MAGCGCGASKADVQKMRLTFDTELPIGSSESQVVKFLDGRHISHGEPLDAPDPKHRGLRQLGTTITNYWGSEPTLYVNFYFDTSGKLVESTVSNACGRPEGY
jgi:hypothetical protein